MELAKQLQMVLLIAFSVLKTNLLVESAEERGEISVSGWDAQVGPCW